MIFPGTSVEFVFQTLKKTGERSSVLPENCSKNQSPMHHFQTHYSIQNRN